MGLRGIPDGLTATYLVKPTHCRTGTLFFQRVRNIKFTYPLIKIKTGNPVLIFMVGVTRFELATPCTPCKYSTRLSYTPTRTTILNKSTKITNTFFDINMGKDAYCWHDHNTIKYILFRALYNNQTKEK